ncbi:hypothetical protein HK405_011883 [Cladochytrium tenue]|nr:hypothetical protein HK405_011883 [Cladochytrium tenue]
MEQGGFGIVSSDGHEDVDELEERDRSTHPPVVVSFAHGTVHVAIGGGQGYGLQDGGDALFLGSLLPAPPPLYKPVARGAATAMHAEPKLAILIIFRSMHLWRHSGGATTVR